MDKSTNRDIQKKANAPKNKRQNIDIQAESSGDQTEENASIENGQRYIELVNDMTEKLNNLEPPLSTDCCIYRVPYPLRKLSKESYTPKVVSIGPLHHGNTRLQTMEKKKVRCLDSFLKRDGVNLENLLSTIKQLERRIRGYYEETIQLNSNDFVKMILLDVSFILEMFWKFAEPARSRDLSPWLRNSLMTEFILLENQIPFFIIENLFDLASPFLPNSPSLNQLTFDFFRPFNVQKFDPLPNMNIKHFTDLLRIFHLPPPERPLNTKRNGLIKNLYSATQLHEAGVKFKVSSTSNCLLELKFTNGVLEIPCICLADRTETVTRNIMAFEQCHFFEEPYITDYYLILDFLINTTHDVDLLCDKKIIVNYLGDSSAAMSMVNNLNKEIVWFNMSSDYHCLSKALNEFYENPWHSWKATLRREYFSTPWRSASTIAAVIFLVLTIIQTVCSIIQVVPKHK